VEGRHCRELGRILEKDVERWNEFRQALGIPLEEVQSFVVRFKDPDCTKNELKEMAASAFYEVIQLWITKCPKNATFGALIDVLGRQLEFIDSAGMTIYFYSVKGHHRFIRYACV